MALLCSSCSSALRRRLPALGGAIYYRPRPRTDASVWSSTPAPVVGGTTPVGLWSRSLATGSVSYSTSSSSSTPAPAAPSASSLLLSDACVERLQRLAQEDPDVRLRVVVEGGGCSGFQYKFELESGDDQLDDEDDRLFERDGAKIVIDETSLDYLKGSTIDFYTELIRSAFRIVDNPKAEQGCSCGASFSIKLD